jgi:hypothetical protein
VALHLLQNISGEIKKQWLEGNYLCSRILIIALLLLLNWFAIGVIPLNMGTGRKGCQLSATTTTTTTKWKDRENMKER